MKKAVFFGNCQAGLLLELLKRYTNFLDFYDSHDFFANWEMIDPKVRAQITEQSARFIEKTQEADLIIVQPLGDIHGCYSTNPKNPQSFMKLIKPDCKVISFPRMYMSALFPIFHKKPDSNDFVCDTTHFPDTLQEALILYDNGLFDFNFKARLAKNYQIAKEKEEFTDCKLIDHIFSLVPHRKTFLTADHPTSIVYVELIRQVSQLLNLTLDYERILNDANENEDLFGQVDNTYSRNDHQFPISKYAIQSLGLTFVENETEETRMFYRNILKHFYLVKKCGISIEYPYLRTTPNGVEYHESIKEFCENIGL